MRGRDTHRGGSLHSKLILALYKNSKGIAIGRIFVGSKNFTSSQMQEFGVVYDLGPAARSSAHRSFVKPLAQYLEYLRDEEGAGTEAHRLRPINRALELLRTEALTVDDASCTFQWQGRQEKTRPRRSLAEQLKHLLTQKWDAIYVHSPWTRQSAVRHFAEAVRDVPIHIACLKEPGLSTLKRPNIRYQLSHSASGYVPAGQSHSKIYLFARRDQSVLVFGSANLTPDGWGLAIPGCRPNAEILVSAQVRAKDYGYLMQIGGQMEELASTKSGPTAQEEALSLLNAIRVGVRFIRDPPHLRYEIEQRDVVDGFQARLVIAHVLIETSGAETESEIPICEGWPLPLNAEIPWARSEWYRVSSLIRISCPAYAVETHLVVDLDSEIYEGRGRLRALQYKANEILESLARLMEVVLPPISSPHDGSDNNYREELAVLLDGMRVERYAYKMSRLRLRERTTFLKTVDRVTRVLTAAKADATLSSEPRFRKLIQSVESIHAALLRA
jgi:hypothetical protein